jgi:trans-2,3-dihydro-3-hydroxyanthranilate isomerase
MATHDPSGYRYLHYDVFTQRPLTGNPLAVFTAPAGLGPDDMARITREMNFSECTFLFPAESDATDVRVRIFAPDGEMPFAGHPVIGSTFALAHEALVKPGAARVVLGLGLGPTPVDLEWNAGALAFAWMTQRPPEFGPTLERDPVASALGLEAAQIDGRAPIQVVSCGLPFLFVPVATRAAVDRCVLVARAAAALLGAIAPAPRGLFVFSVEPAADGASAYSRMLGTDREDPATGSASGPLGCHVVRHRLVPAAPAHHLVSRQGVAMGRPSEVHIRISGAPDAITDVKVGGASVLVGDGRITAL